MPIWIMPWVAIALVVLGIVSVACSRRRRLGPPLCRACGYSMEGLANDTTTALTCPECGYSGLSGVAFRPKRFKRARILGGATLVLSGVLAWFTPAIVQIDFPKHTPTWALTRFSLDRAGWIDQQLSGQGSRSRWVKELNSRLVSCTEPEWNLWLRRQSNAVESRGPEAVLDDGTRIWLRLVDVSDHIVPSDEQIEAVPTYFNLVCGNGIMPGWERPYEDKAVHARRAIRDRLIQSLDKELSAADGEHGFVMGSCDGWLLIRASADGHQRVGDLLASEPAFSTSLSANAVRQYLMGWKYVSHNAESRVASMRALNNLARINRPVFEELVESRKALYSDSN